MAKYRSVLKNVVSNWTNIVTSSIVGFFMMPFLVHGLGDEVYGIWILLMAVVGYGIFMDLGLTNSIIKYVSEFIAIDDMESLNSIVNTGLATHTVLGIVVLLGAGFASRYATSIFNIPLSLVDSTTIAFMIIGFYMALKLPFGVFIACLNGIQKYELTNGASVVSNLIRAALFIVFLINGYGIIAMSVILVILEILMFIYLTFMTFKHIPGLRLSIKYIKKDLLKKLYKFGTYGFMIISAERVIYDSSSVLIGIFMPASSITLYGIPNTLVRYLRQIAAGFGNVFNPAASELEARMKNEELRELFFQGTRHSLLFILPAALTLIMSGEEFISVWMGAKYGVLSGNVLIILAGSQAIAMVQFSSNMILFGLNKHKYLAMFLSAEAIVNVILTIFLIPRYGILGAALGLAVPQIIVYIFIIPTSTCRLLKVSLSEYFYKALLIPFQCLVPFAVILFAFDVYVKTSSLWIFLAKNGFTWIVYIVIVYFFGLKKSEKAIFQYKSYKSSEKYKQ
jgi:O-antigen/teichoic acid export membrane protein